MPYPAPHDVMATRMTAASWWDPIREAHDIPALVLSKQLRLPHLRELDEFLAFLNAKGNPEITVDLFLSWGDGKSRNQMNLLCSAFRVLFEPGPAHRMLNQARAQRTRASAGPRKPYPQRARRYSVTPDELPPTWRHALADIADGVPGADFRLPSASMVPTTRTKLCELVKVIRDNDLSTEISVQTMQAYERALRDRVKPLSPRTILSSLRQLRDFGRFLGPNDELEAYFAERIRRMENKVNRTEAQKEAKVLALPTYAEILGKSFDLLGAADCIAHPVRAQQKRNFAVALAIFCPFPMRLADTDLRFGREVFWDGARWHFDLVTAKTHELYRPSLLPVFGFFVDQLVLQGSHPEHLETLRAQCLTQQRPLFVDYTDNVMHAGFVSYAWRVNLGTGCHSARTKIHDELAPLGQEGVELAMRACAQRSERTAEFYRTRAFDLAIIQRVHDATLQGFSEEEWDLYFGADPEPKKLITVETETS